MSKAFGKRYFAASYGHRYGDPCATYVSLVQGKAGDAAERGLTFEAGDLPGYCDIEHDSEFPESGCSLCNPDLVFFGEHTYSADDLFMSIGELREHAHELARGEVIVLSR